MLSRQSNETEWGEKKKKKKIRQVDNLQRSAS